MVTESLNTVSFYGDVYGRLIPLIAGSFHNVAVHDDLVIGIYIGQAIHPIYDHERHQIAVFLNGEEEHNVIMTPELHETYDHLFVPIRPLPRARSVSRKPRVHQRHPY